MNKNIRILHLEDLSSDAGLIERELKKGNFLFELLWVSNKRDYEKALAEYKPDIILCDHSLPSYTSVDALQTLKETGLNIPFILITATISEEFVAKMVKEGVDDYILKDRLARLPSAVLNSIEKVKAEKDRERYLSEIISQEKKFRALIENLSEVIVLINENAEIVYQSRSAKRVTGYEFSEAVGKPLFNFVHPEDAQKITGYFNNNTLKSGLPVQISFRVIHKSGQIIWTEGTITNLLNDENVKAYIINYRDVTGRKNTELEKEKMTADLMQHVKNLEQFAYIISHNLRSPVANILGLSNLLQSTPALSRGDFDKCMDGLALSVKKLDDTIIDLNYILQVRREINEKKEVVCFSDLLRDIKTSINNLLEKENISIKSNFDQANELFTLKSYLNSIFYNLISNGIKYRHPGKYTVIEVYSRKSDNKLYLHFKDNGLGIDTKTNGGKIFGLYKKFHPHIEGKGMGLYMVRTQVEILGGSIDVKSEVDKGSEFIVELPV